MLTIGILWGHILYRARYSRPVIILWRGMLRIARYRGGEIFSFVGALPAEPISNAPRY